MHCQATDAIDRIRKRETGYPCLSALLFITRLYAALSEDLPKDPAVRKMLEEEIEIRGLAELHNELTALDPSAAKIHPNDPVRTMRSS